MKYLCSFVVVSLSCLCGSVAGFARSTPKSAFARTSGPSVSFTRLVEPLVQHSAATIFTEFSNPHHIGEIAKKAGKKYVVLSEERPFITKGVSAAMVGGIGDIFSQTLFACATGLPFRWDALRTATFMMMGLCFKGPALHIWYNILGRVSHWTKVRKGFSETNQSLTALTLDQTVGVAIFYPLYFIVFELFSSTLSFRRKFIFTNTFDIVQMTVHRALIEFSFLVIHSSESVGSASKNGRDSHPCGTSTVLRLAFSAVFVFQILSACSARALCRCYQRVLEPHAWLPNALTTFNPSKTCIHMHIICSLYEPDFTLLHPTPEFRSIAYLLKIK